MEEIVELILDRKIEQNEDATLNLDFVFRSPGAGPMEGGFIWEETEEGQDYWENIFNDELVELREYIQKYYSIYISDQYRKEPVHPKFKLIKTGNRPIYLDF